MPKYLTIADDLEEQIKSRAYKANQKLPSEKELVYQYGVSRQTIRNALDFLTDRGLVYSEQGRGTFVAARTRADTVTTNNIAVILSCLNDYIFPYKIAGINSVLVEKGYLSNIFTSNYSIQTQEQVFANLLSSSCAGAIVEVTRANLPRMRPDLLRKLADKMPVLLLDGFYQGFEDLPTITLDDFQCGYKAAQYLIEKGHQKLFHFGKMDDSQGIDRYRGFIQAQLDHGIQPKDEDIFWLTGNSCFVSPEINYGPVISRLQNYTAVYFFNDLTAHMIVPEILKAGYRIPEDLSLMSNDDFFPTIENISISGMRYPHVEMGQKAAELLLRMIEEPNFDANYRFDPQIVERNSVRELTPPVKQKETV